MNTSSALCQSLTRYRITTSSPGTLAQIKGPLDCSIMEVLPLWRLGRPWKDVDMGHYHIVRYPYDYIVLAYNILVCASVPQAQAVAALTRISSERTTFLQRERRQFIMSSRI